MLRKFKLRALRPRQWARIIVPDRECWTEDNYLSPGNEVDVCIIPSLEPRYDSPSRFHWYYSAAYTRPGRNYCQNRHSNNCHISVHDFGLIDMQFTNPNWDLDTSRSHDRGEGVYLYSPASDDPELCLGGNWSRYECSICGHFVKPFLNDEGDLECPTCEATGLVLLDEEQLDRLEQVREFARSMGLSEPLERQLDFFADRRCWGEKAQTQLSYDFAPHAFSFGVYGLSNGEKPHRLHLNGGLIFSGPSSPGDGSFPALTVNLSDSVGWFTHT
jgi:hypothetical protein